MQQTQNLIFLDLENCWKIAGNEFEAFFVFCLFVRLFVLSCSIMFEVKIVMFGSGGVGKSALTVRFLRNFFVEEYDPTLEDSYRKEDKFDGKKTRLDIIDTAGQEEFSSLRDSYCSKGDGFIIVFSLVDSRSFEEVEAYIERIEKVKMGQTDATKKEQATIMEMPPIVLVGNKSDLEQRDLSQAIPKKLAEKYNIPFFETSAKTGHQVELVFQECVRRIMLNLKLMKKCWQLFSAFFTFFLFRFFSELTNFSLFYPMMIPNNKMES